MFEKNTIHLDWCHRCIHKELIQLILWSFQEESKNIREGPFIERERGGEIKCITTTDNDECRPLARHTLCKKKPILPILPMLPAKAPVSLRLVRIENNYKSWMNLSPWRTLASREVPEIAILFWMRAKTSKVTKVTSLNSVQFCFSK